MGYSGNLVQTMTSKFRLTRDWSGVQIPHRPPKENDHFRNTHRSNVHHGFYWFWHKDYGAIFVPFDHRLRFD
jgi:hypothetical protein